MPDVQLPKLETPPGAKPSQSEPQIFAMPESFRGLAARVNPPVIKPAATQSVAPVPVKPIPPPPVKPVSILKKKGMAKTTKMIIIAGVVLLVVLSSAGIYVFYSLQPVKNNQTVTTNKPVNTAPPVVITETPPVVVETPPVTNNGTTTSPFPNNSQPGRDTDSDGLTDAEEIFYRTSSKKPDTDSDGFLDGNEVFHGYDPNVPSPAKLSDTALVTKYSVENLYSLYYPTIWTAKAEPEKLNNMVFVVPSGESVILSLEEKDATIPLAAWFSNANPNSNIRVNESKTKNGYQMLVTEDQMTVYIEVGSRAVIMSYSNTVKATVDYLATFEMMINSLVLVQ
jgi:hypothetical protein